MAAPKTPNYAETLVFLLSQIGAECARRFADRLAPLGLTPRSYGVLSHVAAGDRPTQQQLADRLGIHRNNMVAIIDGLEAAGLVERHRSPEDRRAFEIHLTAQGVAKSRRVARLVAALDRELVGSPALEDTDATVRQLQQLAAEMGLLPGIHPSMRAS